MQPAPFLDLTGAGIGNVALGLAAYLKWCAEHHARPVVHSPGPLTGVRVTFDLASSNPGGPAFDFQSVCNLRTVMDPGVREWMLRVVKVPPDIERTWRHFRDVAAGVCIRVSDARHDGDARFMNEAAVTALKREVAAFGARGQRVLVCSNDAACLGDLPDNAVTYEATDPAERNAAGHWMQWHLLSRCPVVYHGVSGPDGSITSTFAPTAAVYGKAKLVGVNNHGGFVAGDRYHW